MRYREINKKVRYAELNKVRTETFSFIEDCFNHNSQIADFEDALFLEYTAGLLNFGNMLLSKNNYNPLTIYQTEENIIGSGYKMIYFAIDKTGVCHGYIYGPSTKYEHLPVSYTSENLYFGFGKTEEYFLIKDWKNKSSTISLRGFYSYLPLIFDEKNQFKLYSTVNNEIIYQNNYEAFLIPFDELLQQELNITFVENLSIFKKHDHFEFTCYHTTHLFRQDNICKLFSGKIDKKEFNVEIVKEEIC